jgi:hypothetical protein
VLVPVPCCPSGATFSAVSEKWHPVHRAARLCTGRTRLLRHVRVRVPIDPVTYAEPAHIFGVTPSTVRRHVIAGRLQLGERGEHRVLSGADVEALARRLYRRRDHIADVEPYWVTGQRAADILSVNVAPAQPACQPGFAAVRDARRAPVLPPRTADDGGERPRSAVAVGAALLAVRSK